MWLAERGVLLLSEWNDGHRMGVVFGTIVGAMSVSFAGFIYATLPLDLYGKILLDVLALAGLIALARRLRRGPA